MTETSVVPATTTEPQAKTKATDEVFCSDCGNTIKKKAEVCVHCGCRQHQSDVVAPNGKSKVAAGILALFLGGFGVHRMYLGNVGLGLLYLLFFWTFIPAIIAFVEAIIFLTMSENEFARKYGQTR